MRRRPWPEEPGGSPGAEARRPADDSLPDAASGDPRVRDGRGRPVYEVSGLRVELGENHALDGIDLSVRESDFLGILGPNGSGKTTLLRALTGAVKPTAGLVTLLGRPLQKYRPLELARIVGVVPQQFDLDFGFTVEEMVAMGRYAHGAGAAAGRAGGAADGEAVAAALEATGLTALAGRPVTQLSGGERQRALIAQTLAQETPVLLLDEPLNNLDLNHQLEIMQLLARLHVAGKTIAVVLHDLNIAAQFCDELVLLDRGQISARGQAAAILDPNLIMEVFRVRVAVHAQGSRPYITPLWSQPRQISPRQKRVRVHVVAGGGAASELIEQLVMHGFAPSVGIVSVFDSDYATAQRYELEVVSAPPFQAFPEEAVRELERQLADADLVVVAPVFFGPGNLESLRAVLREAQAGKKVLLLDQPPMAARDMSGGEATRLADALRASGADVVIGTTEAVRRIVGID